MIFFRKKKVEPTPKAPPKPKKSLQEIPNERILTAEGWRRREMKAQRKPKK